MQLCYSLWLIYALCLSIVILSTVFPFSQDTCNRKSNQQNLGTIKSSNLCTEIIEYTSPTETAVCNLASIALPRYVREKVVPSRQMCSIKVALSSIFLCFFVLHGLTFLLQGFSMESQPAKLVGSRGSANRYFDFDKLAEVNFILLISVASHSCTTLFLCKGGDFFPPGGGGGVTLNMCKNHNIEFWI